jgi:hypothetical protein
VPIVKEVLVSHRLSAVQIHDGGALTVTVYSTAPGMPQAVQTFDIAEEDALPYWGTPSTAGKSRWDDLCAVVYQVLVDKGHIVGAIT